MKYRADIDGLRAFAVLSVVISHALPGSLPGGHLGVDVFFVISGYLISCLVLADIQNNRFSLRRFYARRIMRLAPAFFFMMFAVIIAGYLILLPSELADLGVSAAASALSVSNLYLATQTGYFSPDLALNPLMHTWSLAVEEQYYLIFPALAIGLWPRSAPLMLGILLTAFLASLTYAQIATHTNPGGSYFYLWTRAWEMLAGAILGACLTRWHISIPHRCIREIIAFASAYALIFSIYLIGKTSHHPGIITLVPVLATIGLIVTGSQGTLVSRGLSMRPVVLIGLMSYSIYLWHQPLIAYHHVLFGRAESPLTGALLVLGSVVLGWISWRYVERPTRNLSWPLQRSSLLFIAATLIVVAFSFLAVGTKGMPGRLPPEAVMIAGHATAADEEAHRCMDLMGKDDFEDQICQSGTGSPTTIIWGDSHAGSLYAGFLEADPEYPVLAAGVSGCNATTLYARPAKAHCLETHRYIFNLILDTDSIRNVVIAARWSSITKGYEDASGDPVSDDEVITDTMSLIKAIAATGRNVYVVDQAPEYLFDVRNALARSLWLHGEDTPPLGKPLAEYLERNQWAYQHLKNVWVLPNVIRVQAKEAFCSEAEQFCTAETAGIPLYQDDDHLGAEGAAPIARKILGLIQENEERLRHHSAQ